jgi:prepilin-type N-terminal cleavage/methylation domain-containing protein
MLLISGKKTNPKNRRGFTLIELLLVAALIVVLAGVVFPRMSGPVRSRSIELNAEDLAHFIRFTRREAVRLQLVLVLHLSLDGQRYWVSLPPAPETGAPVVKGARFFDDEVRLGNGIAIDEIRKQQERVELREFEFSPSGVSPDMSLRLQDGEGRKKFVVVGAWVDQVTVQNEL